MSQRLPYEVAMSLKRGAVLYNNVLETTDAETGEKQPLTAVVTGKAKPHPVEGFILPIRRQYGDGGEGHVTQFGADFWRTVPEKCVAPRHVSRVRPVVVEEEPEEEVKPVRVRRTRR